MARGLLGVVGLLALGWAACGNPGAYAQWATYTAPGGEYRFRYLAPPWELVESDGTRVRLTIRNNAEAFGGIDSTLSPKYDLSVDTVTGTAARGAEREVAGAASRSEIVLEPPRALTTRSGDEGFELVTQQTTGEGLNRRVAFVDRPAGGSVRMEITAVPDPREREVDELIRSLDVDPEAP